MNIGVDTMLVLVGSHFLEAYPEHDVLAVRVPEAEPITAVPLLPRRQLLAVLVLAAPPEHKTSELATKFHEFLTSYLFTFSFDVNVMGACCTCHK